MGRDRRDNKGRNWINSTTEEGETRLENNDNDNGEESVGLGKLTNKIDDDERDWGDDWRERTRQDLDCNQCLRQDEKMGERGKAGFCLVVAKPQTIYYTNKPKHIISMDWRKRSHADWKVLQQKKGKISKSGR